MGRNPCEKAKTMRQIQQEIQEGALSSSSALDEECQRYLEAMRSRPHIPEVNAEAAEGHEGDFPHAECIAEAMAPPGAVIVEGNETASELSTIPVAQEATPSLT